MPCTLRYSPRELVPYINWTYFFHTWGMTGKRGEEAEREKGRLQEDALKLADRMTEEGREAFFRFVLLDARGEGDDIVLPHSTDCQPQRICLLRQQHEPYLCLADFVNPRGDTVGCFVATMQEGEHDMDEYGSLLYQTTCDRLAEAAAERGHEEVRRRLWGYAPEERLTPEEMFREEYQGKRPAVGYPSLPDQSVNFQLDALLDFGKVGVRLTESGAMVPHASVSGLMLSLPEACHFSVGRIGEDQMRDYAARRGVSVDEIRRFLR